MPCHHTHRDLDHRCLGAHQPRVEPRDLLQRVAPRRRLCARPCQVGDDVRVEGLVDRSELSVEDDARVQRRRAQENPSLGKSIGRLSRRVRTLPVCHRRNQARSALSPLLDRRPGEGRDRDRWSRGCVRYGGRRRTERRHHPRVQPSARRTRSRSVPRALRPDGNQAIGRAHERDRAHGSGRPHACGP